MTSHKPLLSQTKLERLECLAFENCLRLHKDSILLYRNRCFPSAFFLSVLALEEYGKVLWIDECIFHTRLREMDRESQELWLNATLSHSYKQGIFARMVGNRLPKNIERLVATKQIEVEKQNAAYVGLPKHKKSIIWEGRIINPARISKTKVYRQITALNDILLETVLGNIKETFNFDAESMEVMLDRKMYSKLLANMKPASKKTKRLLNLIEQSYRDFED